MAEASTLGAALAWGRGHIDATDARVLLCHAAGCTPSALVAFPERALAEPRWQHYRELVELRAAGQPVAYLTGRREFYSRRFAVGPGVLIPRPETELLVEVALDVCRDREELRILDLGTGSGILAITLALELGARAGRVTAVERSGDALDYARRNAEALDAKVDFREGDWLAGLEGNEFDLIVSNPPYIGSADEHLARGDLRFEPRSALAAGADGLDDIRRIVSEAPACLAPAGRLLVEHGYDQAAAVRALLSARGFIEIASWRDLAGIERVSGGCRPAP